MSDELDPGLRRLFASTAERPADEAFVAGVTRTTSRERWVRLVAWALVPAVIFALVLGVLALTLGPVLNQSARLITDLVTAPGVGWAAGLALVLAGAVCVRLLAPLAWRRL